MAEAPLQQRLGEARQAMEGEEWRKKRETQAAKLAKRRDEARRAMEGPERRAKRQTLERAERQTALQTETARLAAEQATASATKQQAAARAATEARAAETARAEAARRVRIADSAEKIEKIKSSAGRMSPVRTFKTDLAEAVAGGVTLTSAVMSEETKRRGLSPAGERGHPWLIVIMTFLFLILGGGAIGYLYFYQSAPGSPSSTASPTANGPTINPDNEKFVFTDEQISVELGKDGLPAELTASLRRALNDGEVKSGRLVQLQLTAGGQTLPLKTFLERLQLPWPEALARAVEPSFLLGRYDNGPQPTALLILKITDYDRGFAGLRQWEKYLITLFQRLTGRINLTSPANSGTSTAPTFQDQLRNNLELRVLKKDDQTILLYVWLDQNTVAIIETETTLDEIIARRAAVH